MNPFEDFDLDLSKIQNLSGIDPLDASDEGQGSGGGIGGTIVNATCASQGGITCLLSMIVGCV